MLKELLLTEQSRLLSNDKHYPVYRQPLYKQSVPYNQINYYEYISEWRVFKQLNNLFPQELIWIKYQVGF